MAPRARRSCGDQLGTRDFQDLVKANSTMSTANNTIDINRDIGDFSYEVKHQRDAGVGLNEKTIDYIVDAKEEPDWIREFRKNAYHIFKNKPLPTHWAGNELNEIDFDVIRYYLASGDAPKRSWEDVPEDIQWTFERLGIPASERRFLAGAEVQFHSEAGYSNIKKTVSDQGVISGRSPEGSTKS